MARKKIGFLHLDEIHHINHFITVAIALAEDHDVSILTFPAQHSYLHKTINRLGGSAIKVEERPTFRFRQFTDWLKKRKLPRKGFWLKKNSRYLLHEFDALVFTDYYHHKLLKARGTASTPKIMKFPHGAPGRSYSYNQDQLDFDFQLLFGDYHYAQFKEKGLLGPHPVIIGYPKSDAVASLPKKSFFDTDNPTVLYNPHFSPPESSWHEMGIPILDYFYEQSDFNLIFAPHINLFRDKGGADPSVISEKYHQAPHIHIDLGSDESVDMTYLKTADIFLGEVSSQVFEFILNPRPCIFINQQQLAYQGKDTYRFWKCGEVIEDLKGLDRALHQAEAKHEQYRPTQERFNRENFHTEADSTASERAANAIIEFLNETTN